MKTTKLLVIMLITALLFGFAALTMSQSQPYQTTSTPSWVGTSWDTVTLSGTSTSQKVGIITNEGDTSLAVFFCSRGTGTVDSNAYFIIPEGKTLKFRTNGTKILRRALGDSTFSQVIQGDMQLNWLPDSKNFDNFAEITDTPEHWYQGAYAIREELLCFNYLPKNP